MEVRNISKASFKSDDLDVDDLVKLADELTYVRWKRLREIFSIGIFAMLTLAAVAKLTTCTAEAPLNLATVICLVAAMFFGILGADFTSGLVHWTLDSWGSVDIPIVGKSLMIPFREHHIDPTAFTRRDFIVTWGDSCMVSAPFLSVVVYLLYYMEPQQVKNFYIILWMFAIGIIIATANNQTHKWAHTHTGNPKWVTWLQKMHIVLPKFQHRLHHTPPHTINYCIITGWANYPLEYINFWRNLEWIIEKATGLKPRQDDMKWSKKKQKFMKLSNDLALRLSKEANHNME